MIDELSLMHSRTTAPVQFFKDRDRLLMISHAIKAGGVDTLIERYTRAARGDLIRSGIEKLKAGGLGKIEGRLFGRLKKIRR